MFRACLRPGTLAVLRKLQSANAMRSRSFYLAGGTGLALQLGHRLSDDVDFFTMQSFEPGELLTLLEKQGGFTVAGMAPGILHLLFGEAAKASFLYYPYRLLFPLLEFDGCPVADYRDIAAMKLVAVGQRGSRKDFVDLYFLLSGKITIRQLKSLVEQKFLGIRYSWPHLLRSLGYFADAEDDPPPVLLSAGEERELTPAAWAQMKEFLLKIQEEALRQIQIEGRNG